MGGCGSTTRHCRWSASSGSGRWSASRAGSACSFESLARWSAFRSAATSVLTRLRRGQCWRGSMRCSTTSQSAIRRAPLSPWRSLHRSRPNFRSACRTDAATRALRLAAAAARGDATPPRAGSRAAACPSHGRIRRSAVQRGTRPTPLGPKLIWRALCQGGRHEFLAFALVGGGCGRLGGWRSGRLCATRGQTDIRGFGDAAGPWFVVGVPRSRIGRGQPPEQGAGCS